MSYPELPSYSVFVDIIVKLQIAIGGLYMKKRPFLNIFNYFKDECFSRLFIPRLSSDVDSFSVKLL